MDKIGQDNKLRKCLITSKTHMVRKELHEKVAKRHFASNTTKQRKLWMEVIGGQLYSKIFMNFTKVVTTIRELED